MSLAINLTPTLTLPKVTLTDFPRASQISRIVTKITKSTAFKATAEVATLLTIFVATAIWMLAL